MGRSNWGENRRLAANIKRQAKPGARNIFLQNCFSFGPLKTRERRMAVGFRLCAKPDAIIPARTKLDNPDSVHMAGTTTNGMPFGYSFPSNRRKSHCNLPFAFPLGNLAEGQAHSLKTCRPLLKETMIRAALALLLLPALVLAEPQSRVYKTVGADVLQLDLYRPARPGPYPVVVYIHGGSWSGGDKSDVQSRFKGALLQALLAHGHAVASIDYRLVRENGPHFPAPVEDCKDAVRWLRQNAAELNLNPAQIGLWGSSAGAHLAMLAAYSAPDAFAGDAALAAYPAHADFVINVFGPSDLTDLFKADLPAPGLWFFRIVDPARYQLRQRKLGELFGPGVDADAIRNLTRRYSPVQQTRFVPTLSFHGDADRTVPVGQLRLLDQAFRKKTAPGHEWIIYSGEGHGFDHLDATRVEDLVTRSLRFVRQHHPS